MINFCIFKTNSGEIVRVGYCNKEQIQFQPINADESVVFEIADPLLDYVKLNKVIKKPEKPVGEYVFNYETKTWKQDQKSEENKVKQKRNFYLMSSDWTQIPNNPLTPEKQEEWAIYRQQLRDITQQPGYPFNVVWPTQPE